VPVNFDALVLGPTFDAFAEPVTFIPAAGGIITTYGGPNIGRGVFDHGHTLLEVQGDGAPVSTETPMLGIRLSEFSTAPVQNDQVYIPSVNSTYMVRDPMPDGHGHARLMLSLAGSP
jgi:hypothetical protein